MSTVSQRFLALAFATLVAGAPMYAQRKSNIITFEDIEGAIANSSARTAYEIVQMLRPRWFSKHELTRLPSPPPSTPLSQGAAARTRAEGLESVGVRVWLNEHNAGDADYLKTIPAERVLEMRWYGANEAASRFGPTYDAAIEVVLKR
jgi:hypothetical protein